MSANPTAKSEFLHYLGVLEYVLAFLKKYALFGPVGK
jgi:hypothetical protein